MSLEVQFFLAILPILVIFCGLVIFKRSGTLMGVIGWLLTVFLAIFFFQTSLVIALFASLMGVLASFGISLMVLFTILQVTLMDITGAIKCISDYIKSIAAERYEQVMILNVGLGSFLVSIGATPVTMLPPIMMALGFSPLASIALPCLGYDPLTSFSLLAVPITLPSSIFNLDASVFGGTISLFLPLISTGLSLGMLWVADGIDGIKKGFPTAVLAGLTLGFSCIFFVRILPTSAIGLVGVFSGLLTIFVLMIEKHIRGKRNRKSGKILNNTKKFIKNPNMPLWKATLPWTLLVIFCILVSIPVIQSGLYNLIGPLQNIKLFANKSIDLKLLNQAYIWVLISTILVIPLFIKTKEEAIKVAAVWIKRAWSPTLAAMVFFAISYVMDWSGQSVVNNALVFPPGSDLINMNMVIGLTLALTFGIAFPLISPSLGLLGAFISGSETSSNVMFYGILKKASEVLNLDFMKVYSGHAVGGGVASGIAVAKIINAAAVIDKLGMEGEVIRKVAPVAILLTITTGILLTLMIYVF